MSTIEELRKAEEVAYLRARAERDRCSSTSWVGGTERRCGEHRGHPGMHEAKVGGHGGDVLAYRWDDGEDAPSQTVAPGVDARLARVNGLLDEAIVHLAILAGAEPSSLQAKTVEANAEMVVKLAVELRRSLEAL
jgi:hypothetical protein